MAVKPTSWKIRLLRKINVREKHQCWEFTGKSKCQGYGVLQLGRGLGTETAHRLAYRLFTGEIPHKMCICHTCDNPGCCNPAHLFLGTYHDNMMDMSNKNRHVGSRKLTETRVRQIRILLKAKLSRVGMLAKQFHVHQTTISKLKSRTSWKRIP